MPGATLVGISTKMYLGYRESLRWLEQVRTIVGRRPSLDKSDVRVFVAPSFPVLAEAGQIFQGTQIVLAAQNCGWADGPFTGEVSPGMLAELGVEMVEIGHAERRRLFGESGEMVQRKVRAVVAAGMTPLLCVGELDRLSETAAAQFCFGQVEAAIGGQQSLLRRMVLGYEPEWAIGAAEPAAPDYVNAVVGQLRESLGRSCPIIYGGSAGPGLLPRLEQVDGLFLGRFGHDPANLEIVLDEALQLHSNQAR